MIPSYSKSSLEETLFKLSELKPSSVDLSGCGLRSFEDLHDVMPSVIKLNLSHNNLSTVSGLKELFPHVEVLNISSNKISALDELCGLEKLTHLSCSRNLLQDLPDSFTSFTKLKNIDLSHNKFIDIPSSILDMGPWNSINLAFNQIPHLTLDQMRALGGAKLDLSANPFTTQAALDVLNSVGILKKENRSSPIFHIEIKR